MEFTTHFELHSQTTRLVEGVSHGRVAPAEYGILTLYDVLFQGTWTGVPTETSSPDYNSDAGRRRISNLSSCRFARRY